MWKAESHANLVTGSTTHIVKRRERSDTVPKIHYGTIGSADHAMKDAILRDQWALKHNILCFEMEAAGELRI